MLDFNNTIRLHQDPRLAGRTVRDLPWGSIKAFTYRKLLKLFPGPVDKRLVTIRLVGFSHLLAVFAYGVAFWYNTDMVELNNIAEKKSQIGKEFQRRADLASNMTNLVNNYAQHERTLFQHVSDMRAMLQSIETLKGAPSAARRGEIERALSNLMALAEQYPDLKAEKRFHDLMDMAEITENRIADAMNEYIGAVLEFNTCNQRFFCNYFTYPVALFIPLPAFWEYFHTADNDAPALPAVDQAVGVFVAPPEKGAP
ncbi:MAG: LemA family protein [Elusimicrobia bacterium]|nr:LemA family protein [Candidatus Obscuribacterium magneticum]